MLLKQVIGHSMAKTVLLNALAEDRVAHAYLFHGPAGVGKTSLARAFAGALLCGQGTGDACGECSTCRRVSEDQFPDFFVLNPGGNTIKVDQIRDLQKKVQLKPYEAMRKVFLISQADCMTIEAANCLLKILEEPPKDTVFVLTTVNQYNLLPTIISRCQSIPLTRVPTAQIAEMLINSSLANAEDAAVIAALADGLPGVAWEMATAKTGMEVRELAFYLDEQLLKGNVNDLFKIAEEYEKKKEILPDILEQLLLWYRDKLIWLQTGDNRLVINVDRLNFLEKDKTIISKDYLIGCINNILEAKNQIARNINSRLVLEVLFLKLAKSA